MLMDKLKQMVNHPRPRSAVAEHRREFCRFPLHLWRVEIIDERNDGEIWAMLTQVA